MLTSEDHNATVTKQTLMSKKSLTISEKTK